MGAGGRRRLPAEAAAGGVRARGRRRGAGHERGEPGRGPTVRLQPLRPERHAAHRRPVPGRHAGRLRRRGPRALPPLGLPVPDPRLRHRPGRRDVRLLGAPPRRHARGRGQVYAYEFADRTSPPFASLRDLGTDFDFGATHVNELQYLFKHFGLESPLNTEQRTLARQMTRYWGSFVRDGVPSAVGQPTMPARTGTVLTLRTASADGNVLSTTAHREHRCNLWDAETVTQNG
ncbi:carboxylesterase family protein [Streptomyces sp. NPDC057623]|uniref:carboxylesterase family protein n=1 Tax=Streptomyces sp. NPDC057623 TaxID=3346187 RepID=UPI0036753032